jgi:hypothetical protein
MIHGGNARAALSFPATAAALGVALLAFGAAAPARAQGHGDSANLSLKTPSGGLEVSTRVKASRIGLPVYPGAAAAEGEESGDLAFNLSRRGKADSKLLVAKFETADPPERVRNYYRRKLGSRVTKFIEDTRDGSMAFEMKADDQHGKLVQIKPVKGKTEIELVRIDGMDLSGHHD